MTKLLEQLNEKQREAVLQTEGPVLILAGAGSGKTRALTFRVSYLVREKKIPPKNVLAVTFTNKAAGEMMDRVKELLGLPFSTPPFSQYIPHIGTFHSICVRILRKEIEKVGYKKNFVIYDDQDQLAVMKRVMKELEIPKDQIKPQAILGAVSDAKNKLIDSRQFEEQMGSFFEEQVSKCFTRYQRELKDADALDFDDIILLTVKIFHKYPEVLEKYQKLFRYIMVDEYQDTNHAQYILLKLLAQSHKNICVVGDDWQCLPKGTKVKTPKGDKNIENVKKGDEVLAAAGRGSVFPQKVTKTKSHKHGGELIEIKTKKGKRLKLTPNHIVFSKLSIKKDIFYVYLMYSKKRGYRIGQVKGARYAKQKDNMKIGLNVRANQERADRMWVLKVVKKREEAYYWENFLSLKYQIPTVVFLSNKERNMKFSQQLIDRLYGEIDTCRNAKKIFSDFGLDFEYPHHLPQATIRFDTKRKRLNLTMFHETRRSISSPWNAHRISINSTDEELRKEVEKLGISTRKGKTVDWRTEISNLDFGRLEKMAEKMSGKIDDVTIVKKAWLSKGKSFFFHPAGQLRKTMKIALLQKGKVVEDEIVEVKKKKHSGRVYDLDVKNVHNYIAGDVVVHNSIYGWRGADVQNILDFEKDYPEAKIVLLEQNYRSTQNILDAAHQVISKNVNRKDKKLWTQNSGGELLTLFEAHDEKDEARFVIEEIESLKKEHNLRFDDFAILYRTNAQSRALEEAFLKANIPYKIIGGVKFYQRKEVKDVLAYLYFTQNPADRASFERIVNVPARGLGAKTIEKVFFVAQEKKVGILQAIEILCDGEGGIAPSKKKVLKDFVAMIERFGVAAKELTVSKLIEKVYRDSGYQAMLAKGGEEGLIRHENVQELLTVAKKFDDEDIVEEIGNSKLETGRDENSTEKSDDDPNFKSPVSGFDNALGAFLEEVALVSQADSDLAQKDVVPLMTLHSAKGLEYKMIFIVGMEEGLLPHSRAVLNEREMEEERRLCYVGITRAKQKAHLIYTNARSIYGSTQISVKSRFVDEIDGKLFEERYSEVTESVFFGDLDRGGGAGGKKGFIKKTNDLEFGTIKADDDEEEEKQEHETDFRDGDSVEHPEFGRGIVVSQEDASVSVAFPKVGVKKLAKGIAPLKKA